ncbi:MAG: CsbD family protein [Nevskia sp.]|nr:CsbD family protein [Nevskia sp.]
MNKDQVKGRVKQVKGQIKEAAGKVIGDKTMASKGRIEDAAGKVQESYGNFKEEVKKGA